MMDVRLKYRVSKILKFPQFPPQGIRHAWYSNFGWENPCQIEVRRVPNPSTDSDSVRVCRCDFLEDRSSHQRSAVRVEEEEQKHTTAGCSAMHGREKRIICALQLLFEPLNSLNLGFLFVTSASLVQFLEYCVFAARNS